MDSLLPRSIHLVDKSTGSPQEVSIQPKHGILISYHYHRHHSHWMRNVNGVVVTRRKKEQKQDPNAHGWFFLVTGSFEPVDFLKIL